MSTASIASAPTDARAIHDAGSVQPIEEWRWDLLTILTIILLLLHAPGIWYTQTPLIVFLICGLIKRELTRMPMYWLAIVGLIALDLVAGWFYVDNHKFLECYWVLTLFCAIAAPLEIRKRVLALNSRLIIGGVMMFAVLWKAISVSYMSGEFFEFTLLTDDRFQNMAHWFGGISYESLANNRQLFGEVNSSHLLGPGVQSAHLHSTPAIHNLSLAMTWWTILIEGVIGLLFLLPARIRHIGVVRDYALLCFAASTYLFAPVVGFGWLLMIMGMAQTESRFRLRIFCIAFVLIQVYEMPYAAWVNQVVG